MDMTQTQELGPEDRQELAAAHELPTIRRLTAVKRALSTQRESTELDILVTTALAFLESGPRLRDELVREVCDSWPGARLRADRVERALDIAEEAGLVITREDEASVLGPQIHAVVENDQSLQEAKAWAQQVLDETRQRVRERVEIELSRGLTEDELETWFHVLVTAVSEGIVQAFSAHRGDVDQLSNLSVIPTNFERDAIRGSIDEAASSDEMAEVLRALALEAIDPTVSFGTGLVTYLATGYILHAFVARRDLADNVGSLGPLSDRWAILDTPVLVGLLELDGRHESLHKTLALSCEAGMHLVIPQHALDELNQLLVNAQASGGVEAVQRGLSDGTSAETLRQLVNGIVSVWLTHTDDEGKVVSFGQFSKTARSLVDELVSRYKATVLEFNPRRDRKIYSMADRCADALREEVEARLQFGDDPSVDRDPAGRGQRVIEADGKTMAMAWDRRKQFKGKTWPGAWVVTPDKRMGPAFKSVHRDDDLSVTLTPSQLAVLVGGFVQPASERELAQAAARLLTQDTFFDIAARYPPSTALQLARTLAGEGHGAEVDVRVAQNSVDEILDAEARDDPDKDKKAAAALMRKRGHRRDELARSKIASVEQEKKTLRRELDTTTGDLKEYKRRTRHLETELASERSEREEAEERVRELSDELGAEREERQSAQRTSQRDLRELRDKVDQLESDVSEKDALASRMERLEADRKRERDKHETFVRQLKGGGVAFVLSAVSVAASMWLPWLTAHPARWYVLFGMVGASLAGGAALIWPSERRIALGVVFTAVFGIASALFVGG